MRPNHEYWCKCTWRMNGINKTATSDRLDLHWQLGFQWHLRSIELVFKSLDCFTKQLFTVRPFFCCYICICCLKLHQADYQVEEFFWVFLTSIWWGSTQLQCIYYLRRILISRPPRVFRRFKRRSFITWFQAHCLTLSSTPLTTFPKPPLYIEEAIWNLKEIPCVLMIPLISSNINCKNTVKL